MRLVHVKSDQSHGFERTQARAYSLQAQSFFVEHFSNLGCTLVEPQKISSGIDPTVRFIGSHISVLKPYFSEKTLPGNGVICLQDCIRTRNANRIGNISFNPFWGSFFQSLGALFPASKLSEATAAIATYITQKMGCDSERLFVRVSASDKDLSNVCNEIFQTKQIEMDTHQPSYYRHTIGHKNIQGRNFNLAIRHPTHNEALDIGNIILLETLDGKPHSVEIAIGTSTMLTPLFGLDHVLDCHPLETLSTIDKQKNGARRQLEDIIVTSTALYREGMRPSNKDTRSRIFKKYTSATARLCNVCGVDEAKLFAMTNAYQTKQYNDKPSELVGNMLINDAKLHLSPG